MAENDLTLLNTTIRFVKQDMDSYLSYSRCRSDENLHDAGVYAFVLYYRLPRNEKSEKLLGDFHNRFAEATVAAGIDGTFYLPYRKCYSLDLMQRSYPMLQRFVYLKQHYDPLGVFSNMWFEHYLLQLCT